MNMNFGNPFGGGYAPNPYQQPMGGGYTYTNSAYNVNYGKYLCRRWNLRQYFQQNKEFVILLPEM